MGVVHRARDRETGATVAVKLLTAVSPRSLDRFAREVVALSRVAHPGIVRYLAHGVSGDQAYLAMEWLDGETLDVRLRQGVLSIAETLLVARSLASSLAALHERGVVHRDVKPSNIWLVDRDPARIKVLDLGIAHLDDATRGMTRTGEVLGTPSYMATEQTRGSTRSRARSLSCS